MSLFDPDIKSGKTSPACSLPMVGAISTQSSRKRVASSTADYLYLDLRTGYGNLLGASWEINSPSLGEFSTLNSGESPSVAVESSLSQILEVTAHPKYYLSQTACSGILRRAKVKGRALPEPLRIALEIQSGIVYAEKEKLSHARSPTMLYENHATDSRIRGPLNVAPTLTVSNGTGGNKLPLVQTSSFCIAGNVINRQDHNSGNGLGYQNDLAYTLDTTGRHAVCLYQDTIGTLCAGDQRGAGDQYVSQDKCIIEGTQHVRRLTPLECERLQGFPDHWTNIPTASDSARYKALGNSVAIPCVEFILARIAFFFAQNQNKGEKHEP